MTNITPVPSGMQKPKSFWQRPEGTTGMIFMAGILMGGGYLLYKALPYLISFTSNILYLGVMLVALAGLIYMVLDPRMRNLVWYMYKSVMRWITGIFVTIDPIGILKSYVDSLSDNLAKMSKQIGSLQGQMRQLSTLMDQNSGDIDSSMKLAEQARKQNNEPQVVLNTRKAARLQDSNEKYNTLYKKMDLLKKVLSKMYENSEVLLEDTKDNVKVKEQERTAIRTSHSAMKSAMSILTGDPDKKVMFDMAMDSINNDVANKVGEMERFMEMSNNFMNSIDLQNGVWEEEGMKMLEDWEKNSSLILSEGKINTPVPIEIPSAEKTSGSDNNYDNLFK
jgi:predicted  nucleic acid-binding Zn-ribbon protein